MTLARDPVQDIWCRTGGILELHLPYLVIIGSRVLPYGIIWMLLEPFPSCCSQPTNEQKKDSAGASSDASSSPLEAENHYHYSV